MRCRTPVCVCAALWLLLLKAGLILYRCGEEMQNN